MSLSRRHVLGGIGAAFASPLTIEAQSAPSPAFPQIQLDMNINLDRDDVYTFLLDAHQTDIPFDPVLTKTEKSNYKAISTKLAGTKTLPDGTPHGEPFASGLLTAKKLTYFVRKHRVVVGEITAIDVYANPVEIRVNSVLFVTNAVASNTTLAAKIKQIFDRYDPRTNPNPFSYAEQNMGADITSDMFMVRASYSIHKTGAPVPVQKQSDSINDFYHPNSNSKLRIVFYDSKYSEIDSYLESEQLDITGPTEENLGRVPKPTSDIHKAEIPDQPKPTEADENRAADSVIDTVIKAAHGNCELSDREKTRIAAIFGWPEFKVDWVDVKIQIGCVWVIFSLPIPRVRFSSQVLYAYITHTNQLPKHVLNILVGCLVRSAIGGAVVGVVLSNYYAALAAFEALFEGCVGYQIVCALPGLAVVVESSSWS